MAQSLTQKAEEILFASELIKLGCRLQLLRKELSLGSRVLLQLYKEIQNSSPSKGTTPFSAEWFLPYKHNVHASAFANLYTQLKNSTLPKIPRLLKAYKLYLELCISPSEQPVLCITRAWILLNLIESKVLCLSPCKQCAGRMLTTQIDAIKQQTCHLCRAATRNKKSKSSPQHMPKAGASMPA